MNTKTLSPRALSVIDQYQHFRAGMAVCSVPYFNNMVTRSRAALRTNIGKGSPKDIFEEVQTILVKNHVSADSLTDESLKGLLTDNNIGVDCSGFAYYILNAESEELKRGSLDKHISFVNCHGLIGKIRCSLRPIENCDVATLAHEKNSAPVSLKDIRSGDMIIMIGGQSITTASEWQNDDRDHVLVIHQVEYQNFLAVKIHYSHAAAYPEDGVYGTGVKQGVIEILKPEDGLLEQKWIENDKEGQENRIFVRAQKSKTEVRRLVWL
jgi:hypothetical protein